MSDDQRAPEPLLRRRAPTLLAAAFAVAYVVVSPESLDLAAHLFRAQLFATEGFGLWNNWWYAGHHTPGYSVLFPPLAALLTPQVVGAVSATASAAVFDRLARARFGRDALPGSLWFAAATATDLFTGRLTFAFGLLPAIATALALQRRKDAAAAGLAMLTALASPVAALFAALAAAASAVARFTDGPDRPDRRERPDHPDGRDAPGRPGRRSAASALAVAAAALVPVLVLSVLFPEGGSEPFTLATLWPIPVIGAAALPLLPGRDRALRAGIVLYVGGCIAAYAVSTPVGSNAARLGPLIAGPLAALVLWPRRRWLLAAVAVPLVYVQWQAPVRDVKTSWNDPATTDAYYQPLLAFLARAPGAPFRIEIPFTLFHWEAYKVAPRFPLARGWERQLDIKDNHIFYDHTLSAATYERWLHDLAIRYVAVSDAAQDYSAHREVALIDDGLPSLHLVMRSRNWRVYAVRDPARLAQGPGTVTAVGANSVSLAIGRPGRVLVRVRFTPYWALEGVPGCVAPAGDFTAVTASRAGPARLVIRFALGRVAARSPRCT